MSNFSAAILTVGVVLFTLGQMHTVSASNPAPDDFATVEPEFKVKTDKVRDEPYPHNVMIEGRDFRYLDVDMCSQEAARSMDFDALVVMRKSLNIGCTITVNPERDGVQEYRTIQFLTE